MKVTHRLVTVLAIAVLAGCHCDKKTTATTMKTEDAMPAEKPAEKPADMPADNPTSKPAGSSMVFGLGPGFELAPRATYSATQLADQVTITAKGENPTAGYEIKLVQSLLRIWPPQWMLARKRPDGIVAQVITPFEVTASFKSDDPVKTVIVMDAAGRHEVQVEQPVP